MVRPIRFVLKARSAAVMQHAGVELDTPKLALASGPREGRSGHTREVQGLHSLTAAFEDGADRRTLFFMLG